MENLSGWNGWSWYWLAWFVFAFPVSFFVPEMWQLLSGHGENTLSAQIWRLEGIVPGQSIPITSWSFTHFAIGGILSLLLIWLLGHFVFGLWH